VKSIRYGSLFGNSGFYIGVGTGANFTTGTFNDIGYAEGLNVNVPIGWSKPGYPIGLRTEWGVQTFEGSAISEFTNIDPVLYTAQAMLTLNLPINSAQTHGDEVAKCPVVLGRQPDALGVRNAPHDGRRDRRSQVDVELGQRRGGVEL
jgi:hypothetical protein